MVRMGTTSVYVDLDLCEELEEKGFTISQLANSALKIIGTEDFDDVAVEMRLTALDEQICEIEAYVTQLKSQLEWKEKQLEFLREQRETTITDWQLARDTVMVTRYVKSINQIIIACGYDKEMVEEMAAKHLEKLLRVNPTFNLERHIARFKKIMSS